MCRALSTFVDDNAGHNEACLKILEFMVSLNPELKQSLLDHVANKRTLVRTTVGDIGSRMAPAERMDDPNLAQIYRLPQKVAQKDLTPSYAMKHQFADSSLQAFVSQDARAFYTGSQRQPSEAFATGITPSSLRASNPMPARVVYVDKSYYSNPKHSFMVDHLGSLPVPQSYHVVGDIYSPQAVCFSRKFRAAVIFPFYYKDSSGALQGPQETTVLGLFVPRYFQTMHLQAHQGRILLEQLRTELATKGGQYWDASHPLKLGLFHRDRDRAAHQASRTAAVNTVVAPQANMVESEINWATFAYEAAATAVPAEHIVGAVKCSRICAATFPDLFERQSYSVNNYVYYNASCKLPVQIQLAVMFQLVRKAAVKPGPGIHKALGKPDLDVSQGGQHYPGSAKQAQSNADQPIKTPVIWAIKTLLAAIEVAADLDPQADMARTREYEAGVAELRALAMHERAQRESVARFVTERDNTLTREAFGRAATSMHELAARSVIAQAMVEDAELRRRIHAAAEFLDADQDLRRSLVAALEFAEREQIQRKFAATMPKPAGS